MVKKDEEDISIDLGKLKRIFKKEHTKYYLMLLMILIPLLFSVFLRVQSAYLPKTDDWARNSIYSNIKTNIQSQIIAQYPNLPEAHITSAVNEEFSKVLALGTIDFNGQKLDIEQVVEQNSNYLKEKFQNEHGQTYLLAIDPYYYYRLTRNAVENGYQYDFVDDEGNYHDTKVLAGNQIGVGSSIKIKEFHVMLQMWLFKIARFFSPGIDLMTVVFFSPVLISSLATIPAFFIARKISGNTGGFFAAMLVALHPAYLTRTAGGFSDTDAYNVFFPLLVAWLVIESMDSKTLKKSIIMAGLAGLGVGLFSFAWKAWYFIFDFMLATVGIALVYTIISNWKKIKSKSALQIKQLSIQATCLGVFFLSSAMFVSLITSFSRFTTFISGIFGFTKIKDVGMSKIWPNVYTTVAELNPASLSQTISQISLGSRLWLFFALLGLILPLATIKKSNKNLYFAIAGAAWLLFVIMIQKSSVTSQLVFSFLISMPLIVWVIYSLYKGQEIDIKHSIMLVIWFGATIYASSKGVRFILLLVPAFAVSAGIAIGILWKMLSDWLSKELSVNRILTSVVVFSLFCSFLWYPTNFVKASMNTAENEIPSMNDDWYATLSKINDESEPDAIINSWWDFGHWFAAIGNRAVTLDGGRQNSPQAHWLGKLMLTWDEQESIGILRYLDCGSNTGFDTLTEYMDNDLTAINTLYEIIPANKTGAYSILNAKGLDKDQIEDVLQYTHCNEPPENYFITSQDMVGKSGVWAHFGSWNFTKSVMFNKVHDTDEATGTDILRDEFGMDDIEARNMYKEIKNANADKWIAPWPSFAGASACKTEEKRVVCSNGVIWDLETKEAYINTNEGKRNPKAFVYMEDGEFKVDEYNENIIIFPQTGRQLGVAMLGSGNSYSALLMDSDLTASIFTRLFYYENAGDTLKHFKMFHKVNDVTGQKIIVWKIDWEGKEVVKEIDQEVAEFATCLKDSGAMFYGTETCPWCTKQKELLQYAPDMPYTDCSENPDECAGIQAFPTWKINSNELTGFKTLEELSQLTGCPYGEEQPEEIIETSEEYSLVKVEHILISIDNRSDEEALGLAEEIYEQTNETDFSQLVETYSECDTENIPCSLGWFGKGVLAPEFENQAFILQKGDISQPFQSRFGYHVIKLIDTKE